MACCCCEQKVTATTADNDIPKMRLLLTTLFLLNFITLSSSLANTLPPIKAAVIVPGFLTGSSEFQSLSESLTARGIPTISVPLPNWHWIPCLGGRSMRPMLERIDFTVRHLAASGGDISSVPKNFDYSVWDCWGDFWDNPGGIKEVGGSSQVDLYDPRVTPRGNFAAPDASEAKGRVAIIGHSAGGWISRAYLSDRNYGGRAYNGQSLVHSLVTLGSPHGNAPGPAFEGVKWVNRESLPKGVRGLAIAGKGLKGDSSGTLTKNAYSFCCPRGSDGSEYDGDGITPIFSALAMEGADQLILDGAVTHFPWSDVAGGGVFAPDLKRIQQEEGVPWYGSDDVLEQWVGWLDDI